jgi:DNA-binding transcriptional MerR regulator
MESGFRIGEVATRTGVSIHTVRYYERLKLLPRAPRSEGGFRLFTSETVERVQFIKQAQDIGFSLEEIKQLLASGGVSECRRVRDLLRQKIGEIDSQVKALQRFRRTLTHHLKACDEQLRENGTSAKCPVIIEMTKTARKKRQKQ